VANPDLCPSTVLAARLSDSVLAIATGRIQEAGARSAVLVPSEGDKIDGAAGFLVPTPDDPSEHACLDGIPVLLAKNREYPQGLFRPRRGS
jgi:hypothetical protein